MMRTFVYQISLFFILLCLPVSAQTKTEMRKKYKTEVQGKVDDSTTFESYAIRGNILATYFFDVNERANRIIFAHSKVDDGKSQIEMPYPTVDEVLEELMPSSQRGGFCGNFDFESGRNTYRTAMYENVLIGLDIHNSMIDDSKATVGQVEIKLESRSCLKQSEKITR